MAIEMIDKIKEVEEKAQDIIKRVQEEKNLMIENAHTRVKELKEKEIQSARKRATQILEKAIKEGEEEAASIKKFCKEKRKKIKEIAQKNMKKAVSFIIDEIRKSMG